MNLIVPIILIVLLLIMLRAKRMQHKIYAIFMVVLIIFLYTTGSRIIAEHNIDIKTFDGMVIAGKLYFNWLGHVLANTKTLVGNALKMDWVGNSTIK